MTAESNTNTPYGAYSKDATSTHNAALRGASLAFGKPPIKPKPQVYNHGGSNAALAAATKARGSHPVSRQTTGAEEYRLSYQRSGESNGGDLEQSSFHRRLGSLERGGNVHLLPPVVPRDQSKSPSFIAATLAASRSVPASPNHTGQQSLLSVALQRQSSYRRSPRSPASLRSVSSRESDLALDTSSIPPTTSLIGMFERTAAQPLEKKSRMALPRIQSPEPFRDGTTSPKAFKRRYDIQPEPILAPILSPPEVKPKPQIQSKPGSFRSSSPPITRAKSDIQVKPSLPARPHTPEPQIIKTRGTEIQYPKPIREETLKKPYTDPQKSLHAPRRSSTVATHSIAIASKEPAEIEDENASSDDSFASASDFRVPIRAPDRRLRSASTVSVNSINRDVDSLANAIVASSLASSRAASPAKSSLYPPPPPPSRRHLFHNSKEVSRTPSPSKQGGLRTTMRKPKKADEEMDEGEKRRARKSLIKKHPNKHHEGDRKRWRDEITERERKRYEAVWASNKGLYSPNKDDVCNLVAKDIFSRSRLHTDVLEEVYGLIDRRGDGRLEREEFVVGLWLVDQRLKGRKLPIRVSESVWKSVEVLGGIKVRKVKK